MSFILDALKKSETERQQQAGGEFSNVPSSSVRSAVLHATTRDAQSWRRRPVARPVPEKPVGLPGGADGCRGVSIWMTSMTKTAKTSP